MTAPNIASSQYVRFGTTNGILTTYSSPLLIASTGQTIEISGIKCSYISTSTTPSIYIALKKSSGSINYLLYNHTLGEANNSVIDVLQHNSSIYLEEGDSIMGSCSALGEVNVQVSYKEISQISTTALVNKPEIIAPGAFLIGSASSVYISSPNSPNGSITYSITGVLSSDINVALTGSLSVTNGLASLSITANASGDGKTMTISCNGASVSGLITNVVPAGQTLYTTPGTYSFTVPAGVGEVCVLCIGGGGSSGGYTTSGNGPGSQGGGGGALAYKNNWPVVSGQSMTVVVGAGGVQPASVGVSGIAGGDSYVTYGVNTCRAGGGAGGIPGDTSTSAGGAPSGYYDGGGNGGSGGAGGPDNGDDGTPGGGGGAGGYSGAGGNGGHANGASGGTAGTSGAGGGGGGGGGGNGTYEYSAGGGGVGVYGEGASGAGGAATTTNQPYPGLGGSGGSDGGYILNSPPIGGAYGGGAGGYGGSQNQNQTIGYNGGNGAVRIIWGTGRAFPSTNTADM